MIEVAARELGNYLGKHFVYEDVFQGIQVSDSGTLVELNPIEDLFGMGDYAVVYTDEDGETFDFLVHGHKIFQITE